jgi:predicted TIM-barrel fold metal-dependent hydrolase
MSRDYPIFDADLHHQYRSLEALAPYMPDGNVDPYYTHGSGLHNAIGAYRLDAVPPDGGTPGSDPEFVVRHHLDRHEISHAILNPAGFLGLGGLPDIDLAADLARATNDWTINEWFPIDDRYLGAIFITPRDPQRAADEIRRIGAHPRIVQVTVTSVPCLLGNRFMHPIYEACEEFGLPFNIHVGGAETGINRGSYSAGAPTTFMEYHTGMCVPAIQHLISWISEGIPVKFPNVKLVLNEFGVAWLPWVMWRMDTEWRAAKDVPWLTKRPSEYIRESVRFTTQPLEEPENPNDLVKLLELVHGDELLIYSSDYPHWDADEPDSTGFRPFPDGWKRKIFWENPRKLYANKLDELEAAVPAGASA